MYILILYFLDILILKNYIKFIFNKKTLLIVFMHNILLELLNNPNNRLILKKWRTNFNNT